MNAIQALSQLSYIPTLSRNYYVTIKTVQLQAVLLGNKLALTEQCKLWRTATTMVRLRLPNVLLLGVYLPRKEVIQPHLPIRLPCYDFTPIIGPTFDGWPLAVTSPASGVANSRGVTGGVYKARERIHRSMLICDY